MYTVSLLSCPLMSKAVTSPRSTVEWFQWKDPGSYQPLGFHCLVVASLTTADPGGAVYLLLVGL